MLLGESTANGVQTVTFKSVVRGIIVENPGIKTPQITKVVKERRLEPPGNTDLGHRVYNECWRMIKRKEIKRSPDGGYVAI